MQRLKDEQETFEKKIQQLEEQNRLIVQERESILCRPGSVKQFQENSSSFIPAVVHGAGCLYTRGQRHINCKQMSSFCPLSATKKRKLQNTLGRHCPKHLVITGQLNGTNVLILLSIRDCFRTRPDRIAYTRCRIGHTRRPSVLIYLFLKFY